MHLLSQTRVDGIVAIGDWWLDARPSPRPSYRQATMALFRVFERVHPFDESFDPRVRNNKPSQWIGFVLEGPYSCTPRSDEERLCAIYTAA